MNEMKCCVTFQLANSNFGRKHELLKNKNIKCIKEFLLIFIKIAVYKSHIFI